MIKKSRIFALASSIGLMTLAGLLISGDHNDSPSRAGTSSDITDFYAFQAPNPDNLVLIMNLQGLIPSGQPTEQAAFDENVLMEFHVDLNNDLKKDLVIQAIKKADTMYFFGPFPTGQTGLTSEINIDAPYKNKVQISTKDSVYIEENDGMKFFAGPREDPFFFDRRRYDDIESGRVSGFLNPGEDTYAGTNVLSVVIEIPKNLLGNPVTGVNPFAPEKPTYNMWVETKRKTR